MPDPIRLMWLVGVPALACLAPIAGALELDKAELANRRCFACHGQSHIADLTPAERRSMIQADAPAAGSKTNAADGLPGARPDLYIAPGALQQGSHTAMACVSCHTAAERLPHPQKMGQVDCTTSGCHTAEAAAYRRSTHAQAVADHNPLAPTCASCHGGHDILPPTDRRSKVYPLNIIKTCAGCHSKFTATTPAGLNPRQTVSNYLESVHGKAVRNGLVVAATCADCHRPHDIEPAKNENSSVHRTHVPDTCGRCHVGVNEIYEKSVHGQRLAKGDPNAPVCIDCHTAHRISSADTPLFMLDIVNECGKCHDKSVRNDPDGASLYQTYRSSYHGQVNKLGFMRAARCSDCHGSHDILPPNDPDSRLAPAHRIDTCSKCHEGATAGFTEFRPHADFHSAKNFPLLHYVWLYFIIVISSTFSFFGIHTILWFIRAHMERLKNGKPKHTHKTHGIKRFNRVDRINHGLMIVSFFGLTLTGMPLLFSDHQWAMTLAHMLGGVNSAGIIHRICAVMLIGNFVAHIAGVIHRARERKVSLFKFLTGPNSLVPKPKDAKDCLGMFRWFFTGKNPPRFDHWTYWEKFDYWAEIFGTFVIGITGMMLWFPTTTAHILPGWTFNIATLIHGYEALLAVVFIFTIHFFNAHVRPEKFPVDDVMFTGQLSEEEFKHERPEEYERLVAGGEIEKYRVPLPPRWYRWVAVALGILAMLVGTAMAVLIILAGLEAI
ncbi:MAG: hypothetical protein ACYC26_07725 [Phycisphaerales bacterium]